MAAFLLIQPVLAVTGATQLFYWQRTFEKSFLNVNNQILASFLYGNNKWSKMQAQNIW